LEALDLSFLSLPRESQPAEEENEYVLLPRLTGLRGLNLYGSSFRGDGLDRLARLEVLDLTETQIDDNALTKIANVTTLRVLSLDNTQITDAGLSRLSAVRQLEELSIARTPISDDGINHLLVLPNLRRLNVYGTGVSRIGLNRIKAALPKCAVTF
jgi:Leucine-rich repeat (LRR) protein